MKKSLNHIQIVFIVSRGRSGSTLLQSVLDAHPNICAPIESKFVLHLYTRYGDIINWNTKIISSFIKDIYTNRKFRLFWNVTPSELTTLFNNYHINNFSDACKVIYLSHHSMFPKENIKLIVDKNPLHSRFIPALFAIFPSAKFIHLIRDPRAATYSHFKTLMQKNIPQLAFEWRLLNEKIEIVKKNLPHYFYTIKYEDLVTHPQNEFNQLFDFINLPFIPQLLDANTTIKQNYQSNKYLSQSHHSDITKPITNSKINAWKNNLTKKEINIINIICEQQLINYHYPYEKISYSTNYKLLTKYGLFRSKLKNWLLDIMFKSTFLFRVFLYNIVSLLRDKKFKN